MKRVRYGKTLAISSLVVLGLVGCDALDDIDLAVGMDAATQAGGDAGAHDAAGPDGPDARPDVAVDVVADADGPASPEVGAGTGGSGGAGGSDASVEVAPYDAGPDVVLAPETITDDTTWTADKIYLLPRDTLVTVTSDATLTIAAGTKILAGPNSALVITRGAKIKAIGTATQPVVFTSPGGVADRSPGDWIGILLFGKAPTNDVNGGSYITLFDPSDKNGTFGGTDATDDSGILKYVRVEFARTPLVLCGVGSATTIDYLQSHRSVEQGLLAWGGAANLKHVVLTANESRGLVAQHGWVGKAQFVVVSGSSTDVGSGGYVSYNGDSAAASSDATPRTLPTIYNLTLLGSGSRGMLLTRTGGKLLNVIVQGFRTGPINGAIEVMDLATLDRVTAGDLFVKNSLFFGNGPDGANWPAAELANMISGVAPPDVDEKAIFTKADWMNREVDPGLSAAALSSSAPNFQPAAGSAAMSGGASPPAGDDFFEPVTYVGAVGDTDWTAGWTAYPPKAVAPPAPKPDAAIADAGAGQ